jgi:hypothetical protein
MKKLLLAIVVLTFASVANAQLSTSTAFEMPLGTFQGSGKIAGGVHTIKIYSTLGSTMVFYGGATKCVANLSTTDFGGLYEEIDQWDSATGKVSKDSCKEKGFVFLVNQGAGLTYHWGATKDEAMDKPMPVALKKTKK